MAERLNFKHISHAFCALKPQPQTLSLPFGLHHQAPLIVAYAALIVNLARQRILGIPSVRQSHLLHLPRIHLMRKPELPPIVKQQATTLSRPPAPKQ